VKHAESRGSGGMPPRKIFKNECQNTAILCGFGEKYAYIWHAILAAYNILAMHSYLR